jgi:hypothetical protein
MHETKRVRRAWPRGTHACRRGGCGGALEAAAAAGLCGRIVAEAACTVEGCRLLPSCRRLRAASGQLPAVWGASQQPAWELATGVPPLRSSKDARSAVSLCNACKYAWLLLLSALDSSLCPNNSKGRQIINPCMGSQFYHRRYHARVVHGSLPPTNQCLHHWKILPDKVHMKILAGPLWGIPCTARGATAWGGRGGTALGRPHGRDRRRAARRGQLSAPERRRRWLRIGIGRGRGSRAAAGACSGVAAAGNARGDAAAAGCMRKVLITSSAFGFQPAASGRGCQIGRLASASAASAQRLPVPVLALQLQ